MKHAGNEMWNSNNGAIGDMRVDRAGGVVAEHVSHKNACLEEKLYLKYNLSIFYENWNIFFKIM